MTIDGYTTCTQCHGTGFLPLGSGEGRRWPLRCPTCLKGQMPDLTIEIDNIMAFVIADRISKAPEGQTAHDLLPKVSKSDTDEDASIRVLLAPRPK